MSNTPVLPKAKPTDAPVTMKARHPDEVSVNYPRGKFAFTIMPDDSLRIYVAESNEEIDWDEILLKKSDEDFLVDLLEYERSNGGMDLVSAEQIGAMTDGEIIAETVEHPDNGDVLPGEGARIWWHENYAVTSIVSTIAERGEYSLRCAQRWPTYQYVIERCETLRPEVTYTGDMTNATYWGSSAEDALKHYRFPTPLARRAWKIVVHSDGEITSCLLDTSGVSWTPGKYEDHPYDVFTFECPEREVKALPWGYTLSPPEESPANLGDYDEIEVNGCYVLEGGREVEACHPEPHEEQPHFYSAYGHLRVEGHVECLGDFATVGEANAYAARMRAKLTPLAKTLVVHGSHGSFEWDVESNKLVGDAEDMPEEYAKINITRFDVREYALHYGEMNDESLDVDILLIGYWFMRDGEERYEEPDTTAREEAKSHH